MEKELLAYFSVGQTFSVSLRFDPREQHDAWYIVEVRRGIVSTNTTYRNRWEAVASFSGHVNGELKSV